MLTWLAVKATICSAWKSFISWCRERWELLVGVLVGVLAVLSFRKSNDAQKVLEKKNELQDQLAESEKIARIKEQEAYEKNVAEFIARNKEATSQFEEELLSLQDEKQKRVKELLSSDNPEEEIAAKLREFLN